MARRLADNGAALLGAYRVIAKSIDERQAITPAAEWLVDNYYLVERQIREIRSALPPGYYRQLPKLADGPFKGFPRVFGLAWAFVAHTDSRFDADMLCRLVCAYQDVQPLTFGELWAVAITLRIVLVENLKRIAGQIVHSSAARREADVIADRLLGAAGRTAEPISIVLADYEGTTLADAFAVQIVLRLRDQDPRITPALMWLDRRLDAQGSTAEAIVRDEHQAQGAETVAVRNIITGMRRISDVDWSDLFERICPVDDILAAGGSFRDMDFPTRNLYRSAIEELARGAKRTELDVTQAAMQAGKLMGVCARLCGGTPPRGPRLPFHRRRATCVRDGARLSSINSRSAWARKSGTWHRWLRGCRPRNSHDPARRPAVHPVPARS